MAVTMRCETIGLLVFRGIVPIDIVSELVGGMLGHLGAIEELDFWVVGQFEITD